MMKKIDQQDALIQELTTRGKHEEKHDVLKHEDSKHS